MDTYRLYIVSGLTGRFEPALEIETQGSDEAAIRWAEDIRARRPGELWNGNRLVKRWEPEEPSE